MTAVLKKKMIVTCSEKRFQICDQRYIFKQSCDFLLFRAPLSYLQGSKFFLFFFFFLSFSSRSCLVEGGELAILFSIEGRMGRRKCKKEKVIKAFRRIFLFSFQSLEREKTKNFVFDTQKLFSTS